MLSSFPASSAGPTAAAKGHSHHIASMSFLRCGHLLRASSPWQGHLLDRLSAATRIVPERMQIRAAAAAVKAVKEIDNQASARAKALESVLKDVNQRFGKGSIMKMSGLQTKVETIPSGALTLDIALGGGFPKGRIIEVYGPESSGKTTLALHAMAEVQKSGGTAALIDAEHAFDSEYSKNMGLNVNNIILCQPDNGEMALEVVDQLVRSSAVDIIAIDSVAALTPRAEIEGEIGAVQVGAQARLMSQALRKIAGNASKCNCTVIFLNQLRHKIGVIYGNPEVTSGGNALKFYASVRLEVRRKATHESAKGESIGIRVKAKVVKNKVAPPYKLAEFDIMFGSGISGQGCILDAAEAVGIVTRKGSWYYFGEERLAQGRDKTLQDLEERKDLSQIIEAKTRQKLTKGEVDISEVFAEKDEIKKMEEEGEKEEEGKKEDELEFDLSEPAATAA